MGGNLLTDVPDTVGNLSQLQGLILCDNLIENLPTSIARLKHLKSLLLHRNRLKHLPRDIISLRNLVELSLRDNPLVVRFVQDITLNPSSLLELAARTVRSHAIGYGPADIPQRLAEYLQTAHCCVNPKCSGEYRESFVCRQWSSNNVCAVPTCRRFLRQSHRAHQVCRLLRKVSGAVAAVPLLFEVY